MHRVISLLLFFFVVSIVSLMLRYAVSRPVWQVQAVTLSSLPSFSAPASLEPYESEIGYNDGRVEIVENFLRGHNSPLYPYAKHMVATSDKYGIDFRLLPAIAMKESTLGKYLPENSYNAWGYGIYGPYVMRFDNWEEGIETVAQGLKRDYVSQGLVTPEQIMRKYTPPSIEKGGPWARDVALFLSEME